MRFFLHKSLLLQRKEAGYNCIKTHTISFKFLCLWEFQSLQIKQIETGKRRVRSTYQTPLLEAISLRDSLTLKIFIKSLQISKLTILIQIKLSKLRMIFKTAKL